LASLFQRTFRTCSRIKSSKLCATAGDAQCRAARRTREAQFGLSCGIPPARIGGGSCRNSRGSIQSACLRLREALKAHGLAQEGTRRIRGDHRSLHSTITLRSKPPRDEPRRAVSRGSPSGPSLGDIIGAVQQQNSLQDLLLLTRPGFCEARHTRLSAPWDSFPQCGSE
jgi:hypothetical protein